MYLGFDEYKIVKVRNLPKNSIYKLFQVALTFLISSFICKTRFSALCTDSKHSNKILQERFTDTSILCDKINLSTFNGTDKIIDIFAEKIA